MTEKKIDKYIFNTTNLIGQGSFGMVYAGINEQTKEKVAIKCISKEQLKHDTYQQQGLMTEIKIMSGLRSSNIVQLIDVLETSNNYYIAQELCTGGDVAEVLKKQKYLSEKEVIALGTDLLRGFIELIKNGIIHRDLKPANILIHNGVYKIADFGFAKCVDNFARQLFVSAVGTPLYMSPQILQGLKYSTKSDIWSLGFIFYEALYGHTPWTAQSIPELVKNIQTIKLYFPQTKVVSQQFKDLLQRMLTENEEKRISWQELLSHPLFADNFQEYIKLNFQCEDKAKFIGNNLRNLVASQNIDVELLFKELVQDKQTLNVQTLAQLLVRIDPSLTRMEIEYIFNKIDMTKSNKIDSESFKKWLIANEIRMSLNNKPDKVPIFAQTQTNGFKSRIDAMRPANTDESQRTMKKLKLCITKFQINLKDLFERYNKTNDGVMKREEFKYMLKKIDQTISDITVDQAFDYFDFDKQNGINYYDFTAVIESIQV